MPVRDHDAVPRFPGGGSRSRRRDVSRRDKVVFTGTFGVAPTDQSAVELYIYEQNIDGTKDQDGPAATDVQGATWVASFKVHNVTTEQVVPEIITLYGVREAKFSIKNVTGQSLALGATVKIEGLSPYAP